MFIHCRNSNCKYYYEDSCTINLENEMVSFDESGTCESFECGRSDYYDMSEEFNQNKGKKYIYNAGVDEYTFEYETSFDAKYDAQECTMLEYDMEKSLVLFANGEEEVVETEYLVEVGDTND